MSFLSIIIPAYNEEERLGDTLMHLRAYVEKQSFETEVLIVDDGSTDGTIQLIKDAAKQFPALRLIQHEKNTGKGGAVKTGMLAAKGEWRLFMDADYSTAVTEFDKFLPHLKEADILIGSRYIEKDSIKIRQPWKRRIGSRGFNLLVQRTLLPGIVDTQCGFKVFSAAATEAIFPLQTLQRWAFDVELLTIAHELGYKIKEIPVSWYDAQQSRLKVRKAATQLVKDIRTIQFKVKHKEYGQKRVS